MMSTEPSSGQVCARAVYVVAAPAVTLCDLLCICHPATHGKTLPCGGGAFASRGPGRRGTSECVLMVCVFSFKLELDVIRKSGSRGLGLAPPQPGIPNPYLKNPHRDGQLCLYLQFLKLCPRGPESLGEGHTQ